MNLQEALSFGRITICPLTCSITGRARGGRGGFGGGGGGGGHGGYSGNNGSGGAGGAGGGAGGGRGAAGGGIRSGSFGSRPPSGISFGTQDVQSLVQNDISFQVGFAHFLFSSW